MSVFTVLLLVSMAAATTAAPAEIVPNACTFTDPEGYTYDFSALQSASHYTVSSVLVKSYFFFFNVCGSIKYEDPNHKCPSDGTATCEVQDLNGEMVGSLLYGNVSTGEWEWAHGPSAGPVYVSTGGDCETGSRQERISRVYLECDETATTPLATCLDDNYWDCYVDLQIKTNLACKKPTEYRCLDNACVIATNGLPKEECAKFCGN